MNNSVDNVTLFAVFVNDILNIYKKDRQDYEELFALTKGYDLSDPFGKVPMKLYNDMCQWLEDNLGKFNLIRAGRTIGETVFTSLVTNKIISENASPIVIMQALVMAAKQMVQDPHGRGWVILENTEKNILMRRTQTFNSKLQIGLLDGLISKCGVYSIKVDYKKSVEKGDEYDEYLVSWMNR